MNDIADNNVIREFSVTRLPGPHTMRVHRFETHENGSSSITEQEVPDDREHYLITTDTSSFVVIGEERLTTLKLDRTPRLINRLTGEEVQQAVLPDEAVDAIKQQIMREIVSLYDLVPKKGAK